MKKIIFVILFVFIAINCGGKKRENLFVEREVTVGSNTYRYRVYVPKNRQPDEKTPVMLYLHGSGSRGDDNESQTQGFNTFIAENPERFSFIIVAPQCRRDTFWAGEMTEQAIKALDQTVWEFNGDEKKLYLAGYSMGGYGTWQTAVLYPDKFAALVPIAGGIIPPFELTPEHRRLVSPKIIALVESADPYKAFGEKIGNTPVWVFHGKRDDAVPVSESRKIVEALKNAGKKNINFTEYEGGHDIVAEPFRDPKFFEWLLQQHLN